MSNKQTEIPVLFESYRNELEEGNLAEAVETAIHIEEVEAEVDSLLDDFVEAVTAGDTVLARTILDQIAEAYASSDQNLQARIQRAVASIEGGTLTPTERQRLLRFTRRAAQTDLTRAGFLMQAINFFEGDQDESSIVETARSAKKAEQEIAQSVTSVNSVAKDATLDATPSLLGVEGPETTVSGTTVTLTVTVANVGDATSDELTLTVDAGEGVTENQSEYTVGELGGGQRRQLEVTLTGDSPGTRNVTLSLRSEESVAESTSHSIEVNQAEQSVREAIIGDNSREIDASDIRTAISYWADDDPIPGTGGKTVDTERLQSIITEWTETREEASDE